MSPGRGGDHFPMSLMIGILSVISCRVLGPHPIAKDGAPSRLTVIVMA